MKITTYDGYEIQGVRPVAPLRLKRSNHIKWETKELCVNCDTEMDIITEQRMNFKDGSLYMDDKLSCPVCSYGFFLSKMIE